MNFPFKKLTIVLIASLSIPILGLVINRYGYVQTFPYGKYYHLSVIYSLYISRLLLIGGVLGLIGGLIFPRLTLWFGVATRLRALAIYGLVLCFSYISSIETRYLYDIAAKQGSENIVLIYETLRPGDSKSIILEKVQKIDTNMTHNSNSYGSYDRIIGFPYAKRNKLLLRISLPGLIPKNEIVIMFSNTQEGQDPIAERFILMKKNTIVSMKPILKEEDPKVYKGIMELGSDYQTFTPCEAVSPMWLDFSEFENDNLLKVFKKYREEPDERQLIILTGAIGPKLKCDGCELYDRSFKIFNYSSIRPTGKKSCGKRY